MSEPKTLRERCEELIGALRLNAREGVCGCCRSCAEKLEAVLAADLAQGPHPESEHAVCLLAIANLQAQLDARGTVWTDSTTPPAPGLAEFYGKGSEMTDGVSLSDALSESRASWPTPWQQLDEPEARQ